MKRTFLLSATLVCLIAGMNSPASSQGQKPAQPSTMQDAKAGVLVELFTSEGCSSCPPADALLRQLDNMQPVNSVGIVVLGEHVDYWDGVGWRDRFSSQQYTDRQKDYARRFSLDSPFTPQMVVDGTQQLVGNNTGALQAALNKAASTNKATLRVSAEPKDQKHLALTVDAGPLPAGSKRADLYVALADNSAETQVGGGENSGRKLQHVAVARSLRKCGTVPAAGAQLQVTVPLEKGSELQNQRLVVFLQEPGTGHVLGAAAKQLK
ncbi:MAG TPA: DUF1223 domain-containing protein [Terriglobales bacterium]